MSQKHLIPAFNTTGVPYSSMHRQCDSSKGQKGVITDLFNYLSSGSLVLSYPPSLQYDIVTCQAHPALVKRVQ